MDKEETYIVYQHTNLLNNKKYIGITKRTPEERWGKNGSNYQTTPRFWNAIKKYGWDNFSHIILYSNLTKDEACDLEKHLIKESNTTDKEFGYNISEGGSAPTMPLEIRKRMSEIMKGNKNGLGKPCSDEKKRKISESQKGRKLTKEHREKLSKAKLGKKGRPCSDDVKKKISKSHKKKPVFCKENGIVYESIQECARQLNIEATYVCACCRGRVKKIHGYHFCYADDNINA